MSNLKLNNLQVSYAKSWAGLTTDNHMYAIYQNDVQLASDIVTEVFNRMGHVGLDTFMSKYPTKIFDHDGEYEWMLKGDSRRAIQILGYSAADTARPGVGKTLFQITLAERHFVASDYVSFDDVDFGVRLEDDGTPDAAGNVVYTCRHMKGDKTFFIPTELLRTGRKVSKLFNIVTNTLNDQYGETQFSSMFKMRNQFSTLSKKYVVPGNMQDRPLLIKMTGSDGKSTTVWTKWQEMEFNFQWQKEKANQLMYSTNNQNEDGSFTQKAPNGFVLKQGAGLREQIAPAYKFYYNVLTLDYLLEVMTNLSINILPEDQREFLILTGERGMIKFHQMVEDKIGILVPFGDVERIKGAGQNKGFGGQYKQFWGPQGIKITVAHMPQYDDVVTHRMEHPEGGYTENYRMTIFNIGTTNGEPNIQKVAPKGRSEVKWYVPGSTTPFGPQNGGMGASGVDGYEMHQQTTQGIMLRNPLSACELIPDISY